MAARTWILTNSALISCLADTAAAAVVGAAGNTIYEILTAGNTPATGIPGGVTRIGTLSLKDAQTLATTLPTFDRTKYGAIMYDDEDWIATPGPQQTAAPWWYPIVGDMIRSWGIIAIAAPARDLANVLISRSLDPNFLAMNLLANSANHYDLMHVQAQNDQPLPGTNYGLPATSFNSFIGSATTQIRGSNGSVPMTCGLGVHSADTTYAVGNGYGNLQAMMAATATQAISDGCTGFWMNFNNQTAAGIAAVQALAGI